MNMKCPNCGGPLIYDVESGMMKCSYCDVLSSKEAFSNMNEKKPLTDTTETTLKMKSGITENPTETIPLKMKDSPTSKSKDAFVSVTSSETDFTSNPPKESDADYSQRNNHSEGSNDLLEKEYMEMNIYHCSSCGADLMVGKTQSSTFCSYCGSPSIVHERVSKEEKPKKIIPFKITEKQALSCIKERFRQGSYIPSKIKELTPEKVRAIYIPYWLYTAFVRKKTVITAQDHDGDRYIYNRDVSCTYNNVPMDASLKLSNDLAHRLEPYHMKELEDFDVAYLSGYYADKYDVPHDALKEQARKRCRRFMHLEILNSCPHANMIPAKSGNIANFSESETEEEYELQDVTYALLPAYFVNIQYDKGNELIIVNGQTGKVVGNLPVEKGRFIGMFIKNAVIACTIYSLLSILFLSFPPLLMLFIFPVIITAIFVVSGIKGYNKYKLGMQQLASKHMSAYANRRED